MAVDLEVSSQSAMRNDVAGVAIATTVGLHAVAMALHKISLGKTDDIKEEIEQIRQIARDLSKTFDELTGWSDEQS